jgi:hypothetical protein
MVEHFGRPESQFNVCDLYNEAVHHQFIDLKKTCDCVIRKVLYNFVIEFGIPVKKVRLIKMCFNETFSKAWRCEDLCDILPTDSRWN